MTKLKLFTLSNKNKGLKNRAEGVVNFLEKFPKFGNLLQATILSLEVASCNFLQERKSLNEYFGASFLLSCNAELAITSVRQQNDFSVQLFEQPVI